MKKINALFLAIISLFIASCDEKDETSLVPKNYLVGKWVRTEVGSLDAIGRVVYKEYLNSPTCEKDNMLFNENLSYIENYKNCIRISFNVFNF